MVTPAPNTKDNGTPKKAVGYIRCSTDKQADTSPEQQKRIIGQWAELNNYEILRWYEDAGKSGTSFEKRNAFLSLKKDAENRRDFQAVIVLDESRWGRAGAKESIFYKMYFEKLNVEIKLVRTIASTGNEVIDTMLEAFEGGLSREESKKKSERCLDGGINAAMKGWSAGGTAPYGYKRVAINKFTGERRELGMILAPDGAPLLNDKGLPMFEQRKPKEEYVIWELGDPKEVETVRQIFDWKVNKGFGYTKIAKLLNSLNVECPRRGRWRNIDSKWSASTVRDVIYNLSYTGARVYNRLKRHGIGKFAARYKQKDVSNWIVIENAHPPIVSKELWTAANSNNSPSRFGTMNRYTHESPYLLTGLIRCSHCGFSFTGRAALYGRPGNRKKVYVYIDSGYEKKGPSVCSSLFINKDGIETFILNTVKEQLLSSNFQQRLRRSLEQVLQTVIPNVDERQKELQKKLKECENKISYLLSVVEKGVNVDTVVDRIKSLEVEKAETSRALKELRTQKASKGELLGAVAESTNFVNNFVEEFNELSLAEKKEGMRKLVRQVVVDRERKVARCYIRTIPPFKEHPLLDVLDTGNKLPSGPLHIWKQEKQRDEHVEISQLSSSLVSVPPTRFELVFQA